jgi:hypothetical protein
MQDLHLLLYESFLENAVGWRWALEILGDLGMSADRDVT